MNIVKQKRFGPADAYLFGYAPAGPPVMSVYFYHFDGIMIDTAQSNMRKAVLRCVESIRPNRVLLTHHHEDHSGNAAPVRELYGAEILGHPLTAEKMKRIRPILPYQHLIWGRSAPVTVQPVPEMIETGRHRLLPVHTPGHASDHVAYADQENGVLYSGDLFLGERIKFFRSDENIVQQIETLKKVLTLDVDMILCAHNPVLKNGKERIAGKLDYLENIVGTVRRMIGKGYPVNEIIRSMDDRRDRFAKWLTMGNVSFAHMVRSAAGAVMG